MRVGHGHLGAVVAGATVAAILVAAAPGATPSWSGKWRLAPRQSTGFGSESTALVLKQRGKAVTGSFPWQFRAEHGSGGPPCATGRGGTLTGKVKGRVLSGSMLYPARGGHPRAAASLEATISADGRVIDGRGELLGGECGGKGGGGDGVYYNVRVVRAR